MSCEIQAKNINEILNIIRWKYNKNIIRDHIINFSSQLKYSFTILHFI